MGALEVGQKLVEMVNAGRDSESTFVNDYYADDIVSIEGRRRDRGHVCDACVAKRDSIVALVNRYLY